jgi:Tfp pilus assembly protein PilN
MIRINLLGVPRPKKGRSAAMPSVAGAGPNPLVIVAIVVLIGLAANGAYYVHLTRERDSLAKQMADADAENKRLDKVKKQFDLAVSQQTILAKRTEIMHKLQAGQSGPVDLLNNIGDTINGTDAVWLNTMREDGNNVNIDGVALGANAVANLIGNLKKSGPGCSPTSPANCYFKDVEIKETFQDDSFKGMQAFQFSLVCQKQDKKS